MSRTPLNKVQLFWLQVKEPVLTMFRIIAFSILFGFIMLLIFTPFITFAAHLIWLEAVWCWHLFT